MALEASPFLPHTQRLVDAVRQSNEFIYGEAQKDPRQAGMGTTIVGAWIREQIAGVAHVGDSRAYLWHNDRLEPLTRDHSLMEAHIEAGLADEGRSLPVEQQNVLVRVLGREPAVDVDVTEVPVRSGDYVLLCSDGLTRMVPESELAHAIPDVSGPAADLRSADSDGQHERRRGQHHGCGRESNRRLVAPVDRSVETISEARTGCRNLRCSMKVSPSRTTPLERESPSGVFRTTP